MLTLGSANLDQFAMRIWSTTLVKLGMMVVPNSWKTPVNRGMTVLDRSAFNASFVVPALRVAREHSNFLQKELRGAMLAVPRLRSILPIPDSPPERLVLLNDNVTENSLPASVQALLEKKEAHWTSHTVTFDYDYWTAQQVLEAVLPEGTPAPVHFESVGHIAHLNLPTAVLPYKSIIGQVLLDKNGPKITSIVNKVDSIDHQFRFFQMEVLAGDSNTIARVKENGCTFQFDFSSVFWNSRLHHEHERLVGILEPNQVLLDVFAGVGPFAIPAAKKNVTVYANDLNPNSYEALKENAKLNKVERRVHAYNLDGAAFVRQAFRDALGREPDAKKRRISDDASGSNRRKIVDHISMNLPATAIDFLSAFAGTFVDLLPYEATQSDMPIIHCYCFEEVCDDAQDRVKARTRAALAVDSLVEPVSLHNVRSVAPTKDMYCISFPLPLEVAMRR